MSAPGTAMVSSRSSAFERLGYNLTWLAFLLAGLIYIAAPIVALSWRNVPFPGFFVEQTLVVNQNEGEGWSGLKAGIKPGMRVIRIGGIPVSTPEEYHAALASFKVGQQVSVFADLPDGMGRLFPSVTLGAISNLDFVRLFWLPYLVGLIYLGIGVWIYRARGQTRSGLSLTIFCVMTAMVCGLIFDLSTTHTGAAIWTVSIAMTGAALVSLVMCFPQEWAAVRRWLWVLATPYGVSILLSAWNLAVLYDTTHPWAYQDAWGINYRFLAVGILFFIGVTAVHTRRSASPMVRRQARLVLLGTVLSFGPILTWFLAPLLNLPLNFNTSLFLLPLILFPLSIGTAILRYRLLEIDSLVHRTIVYGLLTAILAGLFTALVGLSQRLFVALTGEKSDAAVILTTLIVASAFAPIRTRLQTFVDRQFKELPDHTRPLQDFGESVRGFVEMSSARQLTLRLLNEAASALNAESGALSLLDGSSRRPRTVHTYRQWKGKVMINLPVECDGIRYGFLMLGPRLDGLPYTQYEYQVLKQVVSQIAAAIRISERERMGFNIE